MSYCKSASNDTILGAISDRVEVEPNPESSHDSAILTAVEQGFWPLQAPRHVLGRIQNRKPPRSTVASGSSSALPHTNSGEIERWDIACSGGRVTLAAQREGPGGSASPSLFQVERRLVRRIETSGVLTLRTGERTHMGTLVDYSPYGASAFFNAPLQPRDIVMDAELAIGDDRTFAQAELKAAHPGDPTTLATIEFRDPAARASLTRMYLKHRFTHLHPRTEFGRAELRQLLESTGYTALRTTNQRRLSRWPPPGDASRWTEDVVYAHPRECGPVGHVSISRSYSRTWLAHGLAARWGHGECWRDLCLFVANVPRCFEGSEGMLMAYYNRAKSWNRTLFESFVGTQENAFAVCAALDRYEPTGSDADVIDGGGVHIRPVEGRELSASVGLIRGLIPPLLADALDIRPEQLAFGGAGRVESSGIQRSRVPLAAFVEGRIVAVALCEMGDPSASPFDIFNTAFVFPSPSIDRAMAHRVQRALMRRVFAHFDERALPSPLIVAPPGALLPAAELRFEETMGCAVVTGLALRHWENFIHLLWG